MQTLHSGAVRCSGEYVGDFAKDLVAAVSQDPTEKFDLLSAMTDQYRESWIADSMPMEVAKAAHHDLVVSEHRGSARASIGAIATVELVGATRAPSLLAMPTAVKIQEHTGNPLLAGAAAGLVYGSWCYAVARAVNSGVNNLPTSVDALAKSEKIKEAITYLPGLDAEKSKKRVATRIGRGAAVYGGGGVALYMVGAGLHEQSETERQALSRNIGIDAGVFLGTLATGATAAVLGLEQRNPELAQSILDTASNAKFWLGLLVAVGVTGAIYSNSKKTIKKLRANKNSPIVIEGMHHQPVEELSD